MSVAPSVSDGATVASVGGPFTHLPWRLAHPGRLARDGGFPCATSHPSVASSGMDYQLEKVRVHTNPALPVHWNALQDTWFHGGSPTKDVNQGSSYTRPLEICDSSVSFGYQQDVGHHSVYGTGGAQGPAVFFTYPVVRSHVPDWVIHQLAWWTINPDLLKLVFRRWGFPCFNLFATFSNRKCQQFMSPYPDSWVTFINAMLIPWNRMGKVHHSR